MKEFKLFFDWGIESLKEVLSQFEVYKRSFWFILILGIMSCIPWQAMGFEDNSLPEIVNSIVIAITSLVLVVNVILIEKKNILGRPKEKLLYSAPTYLIYTFYSSLLFLIPSFIIFSLTNSWYVVFVPAVLIGVCLVMVPVCSVCIDNDDVNYFKFSLGIVRRKPFLLLLFFVFTTLLEIIPFAFDLISFSYLKLGMTLIYSVLETMLIIILTKISVKIFYRVK